jgi:HEAT repeat protein
VIARRASVVVRFGDERQWLGAVLAAVRAQRTSFEIELVAADNASSDGSRAIADSFADIVIDVEDYRPGAALNDAIGSSSGGLVAVLSAHALPTDERWLQRLLAPLYDARHLAVYGAQIYPLTSRFLDKRDLDIFSDPHPREETVDSDFWNANSAFMRSAWERVPFEESVIELEDHYWTKCQLPTRDRCVRFEPDAAVYHYGHDDRNDRTFLPPHRRPDGELVDRSIRALEDPDAPWPAVMSAGLTLGSLSHLVDARRGVPAMGSHLLRHADFDVRWRMAHALGRIGAPAAVPYLIEGLHDASFYPRDESAWALARLGGAAAPHVLHAVRRLAPADVPFAALALGLSGQPVAEVRALDLLASCLGSADRDVVRDAVYFAGELAHVQRAGRLRRAVADHLAGRDDIARAAAWSLGMVMSSMERLDDVAADPIREIAREHADAGVRAEGVVALGRIARAWQSEQLLDEIVRALGDPVSRVRYAAMQTLRLAVSEGSGRGARAAAVHDEDPDFGVRFERDLLLELAGIRG